MNRPLRLALALLLVAGCAAEDGSRPDGATTGDAGGGFDAGSPRDAASLVDGALIVPDGAAAADAGADAAPSADASTRDGAVRDSSVDTRRTCTDVRADYGATLASAMACAPNATVNECTLEVEQQIGCDCTIFVNARFQAALKALVDEWRDMQCTGLCPLIACIQYTYGECNAATSTCRSR